MHWGVLLLSHRSHLSLRDQTDTACTTTVAIPLPLVLGINSLGSTPDYIQIPAPPATLLQTTAGTAAQITMNPGTVVTTTAAIAVTPGTEKCLFLTADAIDSSIATGFEVEDTLKVELLATTPAGQVIETLTYDADINQDGVINGGFAPLDDEFNLEQKAVAVKWTSSFVLVGTVPATATSVQLRISAAINGQGLAPYTEAFRFHSASLVPCVDVDHDGTSDADEYVNGTYPNNAASNFGLSHVSSTATAMTLHLDTDNFQPRTYQLLSSSNLVNWVRDGQPTLVPGSPGPWAPLQITRPNSPQRTFQKVIVQQPQVENP